MKTSINCLTITQFNRERFLVKICVIQLLLMLMTQIYSINGICYKILILIFDMY